MSGRKNFKTLLVMAVFMLALHAGAGLNPALGQCELAKLLASEGDAEDQFGSSVAISGDTIVIGARSDDDNGNSSGSAYIFRYNSSSWVEEQKLLASDGAVYDFFGRSVAIYGDTAVIGAHEGYSPSSPDVNTGAAYIFRYNGSTWVEEQKLLASDGAVDDRFGYSVSISGDTAVIGAYGDDDNGSYSGSAYIFRFNGSTWVEEQKLLASDGEAGDYFGISVAISVDTAVIGAIGDDDVHSSSGAAYIFRYNGSTWVEEAKLLPSDIPWYPAGDDFGISVAISVDTAVIGANYINNRGAAYFFLYNGSTWVEEKYWVGSENFNRFGSSVAISGDTAVIGEKYSDDVGINSGSARIFRYNGSTWVEDRLHKLLASDAGKGDYFGISVAISGDTIVIGAIGDDDNGSSSGSAYVFGPSEQTGNFNDDCEVDFRDFAIFGLAWKTEPGDAAWDPNCDISDPNDDIIDNNDLDVFSANWLAGK